MNGIHFETYVMGDQLRSGSAPMLLHCEGGIPQQAKCMELLTARTRERIAAWSGYTVKGPQGCSVCEAQIPLGATPAATIDALLAELCRLRELAPTIDQTVEEHLGGAAGSDG